MCEKAATSWCKVSHNNLVIKTASFRYLLSLHYYSNTPEKCVFGKWQSGISAFIFTYAWVLWHKSGPVKCQICWFLLVFNIFVSLICVKPNGTEYLTQTSDGGVWLKTRVADLELSQTNANPPRNWYPGPLHTAAYKGPLYNNLTCPIISCQLTKQK